MAGHARLRQVFARRGEPYWSHCSVLGKMRSLGAALKAASCCIAASTASSACLACSTCRSPLHKHHQRALSMPQRPSASYCPSPYHSSAPTKPPRGAASTQGCYTKPSGGVCRKGRSDCSLTHKGNCVAVKKSSSRLLHRHNDARWGKLGNQPVCSYAIVPSCSLLSALSLALRQTILQRPRACCKQAYEGRSPSTLSASLAPCILHEAPASLSLCPKRLHIPSHAHMPTADPPSETQASPSLRAPRPAAISEAHHSRNQVPCLMPPPPTA